MRHYCELNLILIGHCVVVQAVSRTQFFNKGVPFVCSSNFSWRQSSSGASAPYHCMFWMPLLVALIRSSPFSRTISWLWEFNSEWETRALCRCKRTLVLRSGPGLLASRHLYTYIANHGLFRTCVYSVSDWYCCPCFNCGRKHLPTLLVGFPIGCRGNSAPSESPRQFLGLPVAGRWYYCPKGCGSEYCTYLLWYRKLDMPNLACENVIAHTHTHTHTQYTHYWYAHFPLNHISCVPLSLYVYTQNLSAPALCYYGLLLPQLLLVLGAFAVVNWIGLKFFIHNWGRGPACFLYTSSSAHWAPEVLSAL